MFSWWNENITIQAAVSLSELIFYIIKTVPVLFEEKIAKYWEDHYNTHIADEYDFGF